jgi:hypothetical protein
MDRTEWWDRYRHDIKYPTRSIIDKNIINKTSKDMVTFPEEMKVNII